VAAICWATCKTRNKACFENKLIWNPAEILCYACALMNYWAGLYSKKAQEMLLEGADIMLQIATRMLVPSSSSLAPMQIK